MCTLSWLPLADGGYEAYFNRDELKTRKPASPPQRFDIAGSAVLAPVDGDAGGTWISVNEHGVGLCLLNHYQGVWRLPASGAFVSRGLLVRDLSHHRDTDAVVAALQRLTHADFQPFRLLLLAADTDPLLFTWSGESLEVDEQPRAPLISSLDIERATSNRHAAFARVLQGDAPSSEALLAFHCSHHPQPSPASVCMHRPEAQTVSLTRLRIESDHVSLSYADGSPCGATLGAPLRLARHRSAVG